MYGNIKHNAEYINTLLNFIRYHYNIDAISIKPAKRGFFGETWKLDAANMDYFIKLDYSTTHKEQYERSFQVIERLNNYGIDCISKIVKTNTGNLSTYFNEAVIGVFNWIHGENIENDETKIPEYQMLAQVYNVPHSGLAVPTENFSGRSADKFFSQWQSLENNHLRSLFEKNRTKLEHRAERIKYFANLCRDDTNDFCITHGDAGGNIIKKHDTYYIVDWDDTIIAPPERDAWNMLCYEGKSDWARCLFQKALRQHGNMHVLRNERLAYYCYFYYFFYMTEYLDAFLQIGNIHEEVERYFIGWIENRASYADKFF